MPCALSTTTDAAFTLGAAFSLGRDWCAEPRAFGRPPDGPNET